MRGDHLHKKTTADRLIFRFLSPPDSSEIIDANASRTEVSIDYVATGIPKAGDQFGDVLYLDDASPWSLSLVLVLPPGPVESVRTVGAGGLRSMRSPRHQGMGSQNRRAGPRGRPASGTFRGLETVD